MNFAFMYLSILSSDLNECLLPSNDTRADSCDQTCTNTAGGFICACNEGYYLAEDLHTCEGIENIKYYIFYMYDHEHTNTHVYMYLYILVHI